VNLLKNGFKLASLVILGVFYSYAAAIAADKPAKAVSAKTAKTAAKKPAKTAQAKKAASTLTVYYFHGYARCSSCRKIEQYTKEAADSAASSYPGRVRFSALNIEEDANEHFVNDYQLTSKTVVLQPEKNGKAGAWEKLDRIWFELANHDRFVAYVKAHIVKQLEAK